jgi:FkbM family methyltransferase
LNLPFIKMTVLECRIAYNKYGGYCIPESCLHRPAVRRVLSGSIHEPDTIEYIAAHCSSGDVIHAGTFFGDFLPGVSAALPSESKIWAFEPNFESYRCARITIEINNLRNVVLACKALGDQKGRAFLQTRDFDDKELGGSSRIVSTLPFGYAHGSFVEIDTIDDVVPRERNVALIHLDVEGYEDYALRGGINTIKRCLPILIIETWPKKNILDDPWFSDNILNQGYKKVADIHGNSLFTCSS